MVNADSRLTPIDRKAIEMLASQGRQMVEELRSKGAENPEEQVAQQLLPPKYKKSTAARRMLNIVLGIDEVQKKPYSKPTIDVIDKKPEPRKAPTFEYVAPEESEDAIILTGSGSYNDFESGSLRFELDNPEERAQSLLEQAQATLNELEQKLEEMRSLGASQQNITIIQHNVLAIQVVQDGLQKVNDTTSLEDIAQLERNLADATMQANETVINALGEYDKRYVKVKNEIQALKNDLEKNAKILGSYGVDSSVKLSTVAMFERAVKDLEKNKSVEGLVRLEEYIGKFQSQLQKTINSNRSSNAVSRAGDAGVKDNAARCLLEGSIEQFTFYKQVEGLVSHESKVGNALLDTVVIKGSESILSRTESYTVSRDGQKIVYQVPEIDMKHEQTRHSDSDAVNLEYLGEAIVNASSYIARDRERREEFKAKKGVETVSEEEKQGQIKLRNYIIKTFNGQVLNGTGKKISLTFEGKKPIVTVEGGELTYGELRKLDKIIESQMFTESGKRKGIDEFPPQEF
ncbi:MAG: hypothetical protein J6J23_04110 [Clostridia bacterium]|nr:hypothetical protein [Clostridia bacterium]